MYATQYAPVVSVFGLAGASRRAVQARTIEDVEELLAAAGPLTILDIAGGLDVSLREASMLVGKLQYAGCIHEDEDEWGRYSLIDGDRRLGGLAALEQHEQRRALVHALADPRVDSLDRAGAPRP